MSFQNPFKVNRMSIGNLCRISPRDSVLRSCIDGITTPLYRACVEVVYTSLDPDLWDGPVAKSAVADMYFEFTLPGMANLEEK